MILLLFAAVFLGSLFFSGLMLCYPAGCSLIDIPNERSLHSLPIPKGGGVAIALTFLSGIFALKLAGFLPGFLFQALMGAGSFAALIGLLDDWRDIPPGIRLVLHFVCAAWALFWLGGMPPLMVFGRILDLGWLGHGVAAIYLAWLLNLYNFMDGIDGIAGIETVTVCTGGIILWALSSAGEALWMPPALLAASAAGFLFWNFPVARLFVGDAGSGFIGIILGVLSLHAGWAAAELFWGWAILLGAFIVDTTFTLLRRICRGEKFYLPHCSHAYQHAAKKYDAHWPVALAYGAINLFWLLPLAALVVSGLIDGFLGLLIAYTPLTGAAIFFEAGKNERVSL